MPRARAREALLLWAALMGCSVAEFENIEKLTQLGFKPRVCIDGGANMGKWSEAFRQVFPETRLVMVEANPNLNGTLRQVAKRLGHTDVVIAALYNEKAQVPFYISEPTSKGNSVFKEQTEYFEGVQPVKIDALPLDDIARNMGVLDSVDVLKLDVQGAEGVALEGANEILKIASVVTLEMSLVEYNKGGSCYDEVDQRLRSHGFTLYDMLGASHVPHLFNTPGAGQIDAIWVRPSSSVLQKVLKDAKYCFSRPTALNSAAHLEAQIDRLKLELDSARTAAAAGQGSALLKGAASTSSRHSTELLVSLCIVSGLAGAAFATLFTAGMVPGVCPLARKTSSRGARLEFGPPSGSGGGGSTLMLRRVCGLVLGVVAGGALHVLLAYDR